MPDPLFTLIFLFFTIFWAVLFWRLMRAHETMAEAVHRISLKINQEDSLYTPYQDIPEREIKGDK